MRTLPGRSWGQVTAWRVFAAAVSGVLLYLTFAPLSYWWLAPIGLALLFAVLRGLGPLAGFVLGGVAGFTMNLPLFWWTGEYVGPIGSVPLALLQAGLIGISAAAIAVVTRAPVAPLWASLLWVAGEMLRAEIPFGGFPWARLAFGQVDGVWLPLAAVGGAPLVSFAVAVCGFFLADLVSAVRRDARRWTRSAVLAATLAPVMAGVGAARLVDAAAEQGEATVALVQGNVPKPGLDFSSERRAVLDNHVAETQRLARAAAAGRVPAPDLVIWPENSSDIDPYTNLDAYRRIERAVESVGVPVLVGAVTGGGGPTPRNTMLLWDPVRGPVAEYAKRRLQPFGETMPLRSLFRIFSDKVDRAGRFVPGEDPTVFDVGAAKIAMAMCYEVIFDDVVRASIRNGANLLAVPSNNATFGYSDMTYQQLAIDRLRAVEHGRSVLVPTTSGVSAVIWPDGRVMADTEMFEPATLVRSVPLRTSLTLADRLGPVPERAMVGAGLSALIATLVLGRRGVALRRSEAGAVNSSISLAAAALVTVSLWALPADPVVASASPAAPSPVASPATPPSQPSSVTSPSREATRGPDKGEQIFSYVVMGLALAGLALMVTMLGVARRRDAQHR